VKVVGGGEENRQEGDESAGDLPMGVRAAGDGKGRRDQLGIDIFGRFGKSTTRPKLNRMELPVVGARVYPPVTITDIFV
jgi:hypothetical protein